MAALYCPVLVTCVIAISGLYTEAADIKVASILTPPYLYKDKDGQYTGYMPDLLDKLGYNYTMYENLRYGAKDVNGSWVGMIRQVIDGEVDIAGLLTMTKIRMMEVDFSYPIQSVGPVIVMKKPPLDKPSLNKDLLKLLEPFDFSVWLITVLAFLVTGTVLYIVSHFNPYEWRRMAKDREATMREAESFTCVNSFWFILSTIFLQGYVRSPRSMGGRVVVAAWWIYVILFIFSYLASLTNFLRVGPEPWAVAGYSKIKSMRDLAANDDMNVGVIPMGITEHMFKTSPNEVYREIYEKVIASRKEIGEELRLASDIIRYLRERPFADFAAILESDQAKFNTYQAPCDLYMVTDGSVTKQLGLALKKGNKVFAEELNLKILDLAEAGQLQELENKWFKARCSSTVFNPVATGYVTLKEFYALDLGTFSGAILILLAGIAIGGLITLIEICIFKWAETHSDEEASTDANKPGNQNLEMAETNDQLLPNSGGKRGGATQV